MTVISLSSINDTDYNSESKATSSFTKKIAHEKTIKNIIKEFGVTINQNISEMPANEDENIYEELHNITYEDMIAVQCNDRESDVNGQTEGEIYEDAS